MATIAFLSFSYAFFFEGAFFYKGVSGTSELTWEDYEDLRSASYYAHVWSPYAIPHAIHLLGTATIVVHVGVRRSSLLFGPTA